LRVGIGAWDDNQRGGAVIIAGWDKIPLVASIRNLNKLSGLGFHFYVNVDNLLITRLQVRVLMSLLLWRAGVINTPGWIEHTL
jgi:hypothetical protein